MRSQAKRDPGSMGSAGASGAAAEKMGKGRLAAYQHTMARSIAGACELDHAST
jgi:hypothetical protein